MTEKAEKDKAYKEAAPEAIGRHFADMFHGMIEGGMERQEALQILITYAQASPNGYEGRRQSMNWLHYQLLRVWRRLSGRGRAKEGW